MPKKKQKNVKAKTSAKRKTKSAATYQSLCAKQTRQKVLPTRIIVEIGEGKRKVVCIDDRSQDDVVYAADLKAGQLDKMAAFVSGELVAAGFCNDPAKLKSALKEQWQQSYEDALRRNA